VKFYGTWRRPKRTFLSKKGIFMNINGKALQEMPQKIGFGLGVYPPGWTLEVGEE
jgi:hypothetical protein